MTELPEFVFDRETEKAIMSIGGKQYAYDYGDIHVIVQRSLNMTVPFIDLQDRRRREKLLQYIREHPGCSSSDMVEAFDQPQCPSDFLRSKVYTDLDKLSDKGWIRCDINFEECNMPVRRYYAVPRP